MSSSSPSSWFRPYLRRYKRAVALAIGLGLLASACAALLMFTSGYLISATALAGTTLFSIMTPVACVQLFGFGRPATRYLERLASHDWVLRLTSDLRLTLFRAVDARIDDPALRRSTGEYLSLLADDVAHLQNLYLRVVFPTCIAYLLAAGTALVFGVFSIGAALVMLISLVVLSVVVPSIALLATRAAVARAKTLKADEYASLADDMAGSADWMLAGRRTEVITRHGESDERVRALEAGVRMRQRVFSLVSTLSLGALTCWIIVWAGAMFGEPGQNPNWIAAFALGFFPVIEAMATLPVALSESTQHRDAIRRLGAFTHESDGETSDHSPHSEEQHRGNVLSSENAMPAKAERLQERPTAAVELHNITYVYPRSKHPAVQNLSLTIGAGESVAILGRSGAGKSTLSNIMRGTLKPQSGSLRILGEAVDKDAVNKEAIGSEAPAPLLVAYIGQSPYLFNRTLRENLTMGVNERDDEALIRVIRSVGLGERYEKLANGLDTVIGETGVGFSGGEAHRIAIARAIVADTPIVLVDEPFSALDPETEHLLLGTLLDSCKQKTLIVITHHLAEIDRFDRVVFIEDGGIALDGPPKKLATTSTRFKSLLEFDR